jgi:hypothetical protein
MGKYRMRLYFPKLMQARTQVFGDDARTKDITSNPHRRSGVSKLEAQRAARQQLEADAQVRDSQMDSREELGEDHESTPSVVSSTLTFTSFTSSSRVST